MTTTSATSKDNKFYSEILVWIIGMSSDTLPTILMRNKIVDPKAADDMYDIAAKFYRDEIGAVR